MAEKGKMRMFVKTVDAALQDDREGFVSKYLSPINACICCNTANFSFKVNEAFLSGFDYDQIIEMFSEESVRKTGRALTKKVLEEHFHNHFNYTGAAIAEYNRIKGVTNLPDKEHKQIKNIFEIAVAQRVNDLELLDLAMKQQIDRLKELEDIKKERIKTGRIDNLDQLIMKQEQITHNLTTQVMNKLKIWQKAQFQSKQIEYMDKTMQFLDPKTADFLGIDAAINLDPKLAKQAERLYIKTVLENIVKVMNISFDSALHLSQQQKSTYFTEFRKLCEGLEDKINTEYKITLANLKEVGQGQVVEVMNIQDEDDIIEQKIEDGEIG